MINWANEPPNQKTGLLMNTKIAVLFAALFLSGNALADTYYGILNAVSSNSGRTHHVTFTYEIDLTYKDNVTGVLKIAGPVTSCSGDHELISGSIKDNVVILRTKKPEGFRCGAILFKGEVVGNKFVGKVPWNGIPTDLELEKKN